MAISFLAAENYLIPSIIGWLVVSGFLICAAMAATAVVAWVIYRLFGIEPLEYESYETWRQRKEAESQQTIDKGS